MKIKINSEIPFLWFVAIGFLFALFGAQLIGCQAKTIDLLAGVMFIWVVGSAMFTLYDTFFIWIEPDLKFPRWQKNTARMLILLVVLSVVVSYVLGDDVVALKAGIVGFIIFVIFGRLCHWHSERLYEANRKRH